MNLPVTDRFHLEVTHCAWCRCFPCVCQREAPCRCGGLILANEGAIPDAVRAHQMTPRHRAWREARGL